MFKKRFGEEDKRWCGISTVVPGSNSARWKEQFIWPFSTELVVLHVDDDYQGSALATPDRKLAWVFGREPTMDAARGVGGEARRAWGGCFGDAAGASTGPGR